MIPLAQWLRADLEVQRPEHPTAATFATPHNDTSMRTEDNEDYATERVKELEAELEATRRILENEKANALEREVEISNQLGADLASKLSAQIDLRLVELQASMEAAVVEVLSPFLTSTACSRAAVKLTELIREDVARGADAIVEVRAPEPLHRHLRPVLDACEPAIALSEAPTVEIIRSDQRSRFQSLAERWIDAVRSAENA